MDKKFHLVIDAYLLAPDLDAAFKKISQHFDALQAVPINYVAIDRNLCEYDSAFIPPSTLTLTVEDREGGP